MKITEKNICLNSAYQGIKSQSLHIGADKIEWL